MVFLSFKDLLGYEHRKVCILHTEFTYLGIEPFYFTSRSEMVMRHSKNTTLYNLPYTIRPRLQNIASTDTVVVDHVGLG